MKAHGEGEQITHYICLNLKSIYIGWLYGQFGHVSHEWSNGILAKAFHNATIDQLLDHKWIIFYGPIDAIT